MIAVDASGDPVVPQFGVVHDIWLIGDYVYFGVDLVQTVCFDYHHQAYQVTERTDNEKSVICSFESLVDFNVFHMKRDHRGNKYIPVKYDIDDLIEEHVEGRNPFHL